MNLILYHIFGEKFIAFLLGILILEGVLMCGVALFVVVRIVQEELLLRNHHPKK